LANSSGGTKADFTITENTGLIINSYEGASARSINLQVGGASALSIASGGAATFSSSVTATQGIFQNTSGNQLRIAYDSSYYWTLSRVAVDGRFALVDSINGEKISITTAGNVGIGTTAPFAVLTSQAPSSGAIGLGIVGRASDNYGLITFRNNDAATTVLEIGGNTSGGYFFNNYANTFTSFATNGSERMRITSGGALIIGGTGIAYNSVREQIWFSGSSTEYGLSLAALNVGSTRFIDFNIGSGSGGQAGSISWNGSVVSYNITSDYRLKEDLKPINGLEIVNKIKVYDYKWKASDSRMDGVLAHELAEVLPYAVNGVKDGEQMQSVDYSKIVPVMVQAIKDLKAKIETLENK